MLMRIDQLITELENVADEEGDEWMVVVMSKNDRRVILDPGEVMSISGVKVEVMPDESRAIYLLCEEY